MNEPAIYKLEGADDTGLLEECIDETGLYWRHRLKCWELWYVDAEKKEKIGTSDESLGIDSAYLMWDEFVYMAANEISGVSDIVSKGEIQ